ncbi:MAG TPA: class I tRNA ligase family protein, partial [Sphingopyxis sp.]|nr:class I tRNA ligase family protein [Sphingopyxis sp.]
DHQALLGPDYQLADYEPQNDILDVWFDSGSTHVFTVEARYGEGVRADLYLEGSDQHRGWFQSSLLESCGTRGQAPYKAVLTHGFTMDAKGFKMSKSLGNTISPIDLMRDYGADILRLWALSVDFTEDHRIGKEILTGVADQYRKLRNTFRYLLGALDGFGEEERITDIAAMPELERYMLNQLAHLHLHLREAIDDFDFNTYTRLLADFCNEDLSAFYFDIRKDVLYCDLGPAAPLGTSTRRAYRSVLDILFHALIRYAAPVLVFTSEEVWGTRYPDEGSVHLLELQELDVGQWIDGNLASRWDRLREVRSQVTEAIEPYRREKTVRSSLEAEVSVRTKDAALASILVDVGTEELAELLIVSAANTTGFTDDTVADITMVDVTRTENHKCGRCWRHLPEVKTDGSLCNRCDTLLTSA